MNQRKDPLPASPRDICPLLLGAKLPQLTLTTADGKPFDLNAAIAQKPTILVFYRGGWCSYCNMQLATLQGLVPQLKPMGYQIIAISPDRPEKLRETIRQHKLEYRLLSDSKVIASRAFGLAFQVSKEALERDNFAAEIEDGSGEKHHILPVPAVFIIGTDGVIRFEHVNPDHTKRMNPDLLMAAARAVLG